MIVCHSPSFSFSRFQSAIAVTIILSTACLSVKTHSSCCDAFLLKTPNIAMQGATTEQPPLSPPLAVSTTSSSPQDAATTTTANGTCGADSSLFVDATRQSVQEYYGTTLQKSDDLQTNACCTGSAPPEYIRDCLKQLHPVTLQKYYGCGLCLPSYDLTGLSVLDLGCGAGRDVYIASQLVGPTGRVTGVDMTMEQLEAARSYQSYHAEKFGYDNVKFVQGYLEELDQLADLKDESFDLIVSNCVLNLCTNKLAVLKSCQRLLKKGGELYFSDVYASRRVPTVLQKDPVLWGECMSGALYWNDFLHLAMAAGFTDPRLVEDSPVTINNKAVSQRLVDTGSANLQFYSATYRLWKLEDGILEADCEDYGQAVVYKGTIVRAPSVWTLDRGHVMETGKIFPVCGNTYNMLYQSPQLKPHFDFYGDFSKHYGIFEGCGSSMPFGSSSSKSSGGGGGGSCC